MFDKKPEKVQFDNGRNYNIFNRGKFDVQPGSLLPMAVGDNIMLYWVDHWVIGFVTKVTDTRVHFEFRYPGGQVSKRSLGRDRMLFNVLPDVDHLDSIDPEKDLTWDGNREVNGMNWPYSWAKGR